MSSSGSRPIPRLGNLHIFYDWDKGDAGVKKLERWLAIYPDTALIIIDVLQRFRGQRDNRVSVYDSDYQMMETLHRVTQRHPGLTLLVVHHVRKLTRPLADQPKLRPLKRPQRST